ncbi:MAG: PilT-like protein [uncultured bacterium]|nr:MAG: PilT-like protein [uncultured bacterium]
MNGYLLDTATFLWAIAGGEEKLPKKVLAILQKPKHPLYVSAVSSLEISIKYSLGKLPLKAPPSQWLPAIFAKGYFRLLEISHQHVLHLDQLPFHHKDPFDRLLVCQAKSENLHILSPDKILKKYTPHVFWK